MPKNYTDINSAAIDQWVRDGWEWGQEISHETYLRAKQGDWSVLLTPTKPVPKEWFCPMQGAKILGLASGGGQQIPIFAALGAQCTVLDYSQEQLRKEELVAQLEGYDVELVRADMSKPLPFADESFDLIFHPVSNCYVKELQPIWNECYRVLKKGGILLAGGTTASTTCLRMTMRAGCCALPFDPALQPCAYEASVKNDWGIQFSHTIEEEMDGQLRAGFTLTGIYGDTNGSGHLHELNVPTFYASRCVK